MSWCEYVLSGLKIEIEKIDKLLDDEYLSKEILLPAIKFALEGQMITDKEADILKVALSKQIFQAADVRNLFSNQTAAVISMTLKRMRDKKLLQTSPEHPRQYVINFQNSYLLRGVIKMLADKDFLPIKD